MQGKDLEIIKEVPGYKAILKAVLKSQIQVLVEQLAQQTGEESVLITASLEEGSLSYLGSEFGKVFLEGHDDFKSQFLGFCLKRYQVKKKIQPYSAEKLSRKHGPRSYKFPQVNLLDEQKEITSPSVVSSRLNSAQYPVSVLKTTDTATNLQHGIRSPDLTPTLDEDQTSSSRNHVRQRKRSLSQTDSVLDNNTEPNASRQAKRKPVVGSTYVDEDTNRDTQNEEVCVKIEVNDGEYEQNESCASMESDYNIHKIAAFGTSRVHCDSESESATGGLESLAAGNSAYTLEDHSKMTEGHRDEGCLDSSSAPGQNEVESGSIGHEPFISSIKLNKCSTPIWNRKIKTNPGRTLNSSIPAGSFKCKVKKESDLKNYIYLDNMERPYPCNACPKRFKERHHLIYHLRTHSGQKPYVCDICHKAFSQSSSMNTHKKIHLKDLYCGICLQLFKKETEYYTHACFQLAADIKKEADLYRQDCFQASADVQKEIEYYEQGCIPASADVNKETGYFEQNCFPVSADV